MCRSRRGRATPSSTSSRRCLARPSARSPFSADRAGRPTPSPSFQKAAEAWSLPVGCSFRRQMLFDHLHPNYAGDVGIGINPKLASFIKQSDLVLLIGGRLGEMPSSDYTLLKSPYPDQTAGACPSRCRRARPRLPPDAWRSTPRRRPSPKPLPSASRPRRRAGPARRPSCTPPISTGRRRRKPAPARCRWGRS